MPTNFWARGFSLREVLPCEIGRMRSFDDPFVKRGATQSTLSPLSMTSALALAPTSKVTGQLSGPGSRESGPRSGGWVKSQTEGESQKSPLRASRLCDPSEKRGAGFSLGRGETRTAACPSLASEVLLYLPDDDLLAFFRRCMKGLRRLRPVDNQPATGSLLMSLLRKRYDRHCLCTLLRARHKLTCSS